MTKIVAVLAVTAVTLTGLATRSFETAQIALINEAYPVTAPQPVTPPQPSPLPPVPPSSPVSCQYGVQSLSLARSCGADGFSNFTATCNNGKVFTKGDNTSTHCYSVQEAMTIATSNCNASCNLPSPSASIISRPFPSRSPAPSGCVYQQVECFTDTCPAVLVCSVPVASPSLKPSPTIQPTLAPKPSINSSPVPVVTPTSTPRPVVTPTPTPQPTVINQVTKTISTYRCRVNLWRKGTTWSSTRSSCR